MTEDLKVLHENIVVEIGHTPTGEIRVYDSDMKWYAHSEFMWSEGNYCCDCNRGLFWKWAVGEDEEDEKEGYPCDGAVFRIVTIKSQDGDILYEEAD